MLGVASEATSAEVQQQSGERLRILELADPRGQLRDRDPDELDRLVALQALFAFLDALGEEHVHQLPAEAGRRPERRGVSPVAAAEPRLFGELALRRRQGLLVPVERA